MSDDKTSSDLRAQGDKIRREVLGEDHRLVTEIKSNLGEALTGLGELEEAESLLLDAYQRFLDAFGPEYRWTSRSATRLAELYEKKGDAESGRNNDGGEYKISLELGSTEDDVVAEPCLVTTATNNHFADNSANNGEAGRYAHAGKKIRQ